MNGKPLTAVYASKAFRRLVEDSKDPLAHGAALRESMRREIEAGLTPTGHRPNFVASTSDQIISVLCAAAEKFNQEHLDDMISSQDFLDALASCRKKIMDGVKVFRSLPAPNGASTSAGPAPSTPSGPPPPARLEPR